MRCGLLGQTLAHSHSPLLHSLLGNYAYTLFEKAPDQVEDFLKKRLLGWAECDHSLQKNSLCPLRFPLPIAREAGNVNTLFCGGGTAAFFGDNTDAFGFRYLLEKAGVPVAGKRALVLGAGGAGGTACAVLRQMGAAVTVLSRTEKPGDFYGKNNGILYSTYRHISQYKDAQIIVNATPVGMYPTTERPLGIWKYFPIYVLWLTSSITPPGQPCCSRQKIWASPAPGPGMLAAQAAASAALFLGEAMGISRFPRWKASCGGKRRI